MKRGIDEEKKRRGKGIEEGMNDRGNEYRGERREGKREE